MRTLHLRYDRVFNGEWALNKLNVLFTFQVNCPGCFMYGFPMMQQLNAEFAQAEVAFLGLSTAFEDFEFNTPENTLALITDKKVVGETAKMLASQSLSRYEVPIDFPIATDSRVKAEELEGNELIDKICRTNPNFPYWAEFDKTLLRQKVRDYLHRQSKISFTFTVNQFRGTPTFVIFNDKMEILKEWFGHVDYQQMAGALREAIDQL